MQKALSEKDVALTTSFNMEGAFNKARANVIETALFARETSNIVFSVASSHSNRIVTATLDGYSRKPRVERCCLLCGI